MMVDSRLAARRRAIHAAARQAGLADDDRRALIAGQCPGKSSTTELDMADCDLVLNYLNKQSGYAPRNAGRKLDTSAEATKVRALWLLLNQIGEVRDPSESALASYCKRIAKVDDLHWAGAKIYTLIETLKKWAQRKLPTALAARISRLQQSGLIDPRNSVRGLCIHVAPMRDPETFDPMWWAWDFLNDLEIDHGRKQAGN